MTKRAIISTLAFLFPALLVGVIVASVSVSNWMSVKEPGGVPKQLPEPPPYDPDKPTAVVLISNEGTESTDLLAPFEILASSGALNVFTVAPARTISPIWHGVDILPHFTFESLEHVLHGPPNLILIPNIANPEDSVILNWIRRSANESTWIVSVCEGARVLAAAGLLQNRKASSHFMALGQLERDYPTTDWTRGVRYVEDGNIITSAGVTASIDATFHALRRVSGLEVAQQTAENLNYQLELHPREIDTFDFRWTDFLSLFVTAGYVWDKNRSWVMIAEGIGETALGSVLDLYPRVLDGTVESVSEKRGIVRTKHGLDLLAWHSFDDDMKLDELIIMGSNPSKQVSESVVTWAASKDVRIKHPHVPDVQVTESNEVPFVYDLVVQDIAIGRSNAVARAVAKTVEYPVSQIQLSGAKWPLLTMVVPLGVGVAGLAAATWFRHRRTVKA